jgi:hypothetical protein
VSIIKEIHSSFSTAEENILREAKRIIDIDQQATNKLVSMGFTSAKNAKYVDPGYRGQMREFVYLQEIYKRVAPLYRFITEDKRLEICKKYGIVMAPVKAFIGDIPDNNVRDIVNFKISDNTYLTFTEQTGTWTDGKGNVNDPKNLTDEHLYNIINRFHAAGKYITGLIECEEEYARRLSKKDIIKLNKDQVEAGRTHCYYVGGMRIDFDYNLVFGIKPKDIVPEMYIIANIDQLNTTDYALDEKKMFLSRALKLQQLAEAERERLRLLRDDDPIVLVSVRGGYLIVTAWGDEKEERSAIVN